MREIEFTTQFQKDFKRERKNSRHKDLDEVLTGVEQLVRWALLDFVTVRCQTVCVTVRCQTVCVTVRCQVPVLTKLTKRVP